ncbi:hypothetical protein D3C71_79240 [compost metagenome]
MTTTYEPTPKLQFFTKDIANFTDLVKQTARLFVLRTTPVPDGDAFKANRQREITRAETAAFESLLALMYPLNVVVTSYSQMVLTVGDDKLEPAFVVFTTSAYVHSKDGDPRETKEVLYEAKLVLDRS